VTQTHSLNETLNETLPPEEVPAAQRGPILGADDLADELKQFYDDPYGFVMFAFPWGIPGTDLGDEEGPDENQKAFLTDIGNEVHARGFNGKTPVMPVLMTATSGHGTGKSVMGAWIACWILSTRPDSIGTVTAGTFQQLEMRTWAAIQRWLGMCITNYWFHIQQRGIYHKVRPKTWKVLPQTAKAGNAQSFAGQHAATSTSWYMFDEASVIPEQVWEVAAGGLSDGEPHFYAWGQCERNTGRFYEINFGTKLAARWNHRRIDSRSGRFANKKLMAQWEEDFGVDSDYYRVRVLGYAPLASELQFIDRERIQDAQQRQVVTLPDDPLVVGVDVSGGGAAWNVITFRRGLDARSIPRIRIPGEQTRDQSVLVGRLAEILRDERPGHKVAAMFIDMAFGSAIVARLNLLGFHNVHETNFGQVATPDRTVLNMRAYMWKQVKDFLLRGAIATDEKIATDLAGPGAALNKSNKLVLESKAEMAKRGQASPDDGDSLALTFAQPVAPVTPEMPFGGDDEDEDYDGDMRIGGWMR
jgi:hypothetical protein